MRRLVRKHRLSALVAALCLVAFGLSLGAASASALDAGVVLKVNVQYGADTAPITVEEYTAAELASISTTYTANQGYLYYKGGTWQLKAAKTGVPIDALLADAGVNNWSSGSSLEFTCYDGAYTKYYPTYDQLHAASYFYPATGPSTTSTVDPDAVSPIISTNYATGTIPTGSTAGEALESVETTAGLPSLFVGLTETDYTSLTNTGGNRFPYGITEITVVSDYALLVKSQVGSAAPTLVRSYSLADLASLATTYAADARLGFLMKSSTWSVFAVDEAVNLATLFSNAGVSNWANGSHLEFTCYDGAYTKYQPTYADLAQVLNFYPATAASSLSTASAMSVPTVLALSYGSASIPEGSVAGDVLASAATASSMPRFFQGVSESSYLASSAAGKRFPSGVLAVTVVSPEPETVYHTLAYVAGSGGAVSGARSQSVADGGSGTAVEARPRSGFKFESWSDGVKTATRTDTNVTADKRVVAHFSRVLTKASIVKTPAASKVTYKRKKGVAKVKLTVQVKGWGGKAVSGHYVYLKVFKSKNGKVFKTYKIKTDGSGKAAKTLKITSKRTRYYRWYVPSRSYACLSNTSGTTRVKVK